MSIPLSDGVSTRRFPVDQLVEGNFGLFSAQAHGGGVAFFAHVGGFAFGVVATLALATSGRISASDAGSRTDLAGA